MMMKVLLTGGAGYIGSVLTGRLLARGMDVAVVDKLIYRQTSLLQYFDNPRFSFVNGDVRDERLMRDLVRDRDVILPLAAIVGAPACARDPESSTSINLHAVAMLAKISSAGQAVIYPTTNSGYGTTSGKEFCTEESPLAPISLYGRDKVEAERRLLDRGNAVTLRFATVFGVSPRMRLDLLVNDLTLRALRDRFLVIFEKGFKRNFLHILDAADCFLFCIDRFDSLNGKPYNVGCNEANISKEELALAIKKRIPDLYIHFAEVGSDPDKRNYVVSNERINREGFTASRGLDEGIGQLILAYGMIGRSGMYNC
ncbi:MAG: NAD(P)-dependent oxidoreductase [Candidatus Aureabacteria bacterium]|nr:NAD(P)-dependent oxidoreductase [Candidatus Auribacterota bacterium]